MYRYAVRNDKRKDIIETFTRIAKPGEKVTVKYSGNLHGSTKPFDKGEISFILGTGMVIKGWDEEVAGMTVGESKHITIPPSKAYGARGSPPAIPPNSTLEFDMKLVNIQ